MSLSQSPEISARRFPRRVPRHSPYTAERIVAQMSPTEYHDFLRNARDKYEYVYGKVILMPGASPEHNFIQMDFARTLGNFLEEAESGCDILGSDQKIYVNQELYYLADVVVVCGEGQFDFEDCLRNPIMIAEILSATTERHDRTTKFRDYQTIASLKDYILIAQDEPLVTHFTKTDSGLWAIAGDHTELSQSLMLSLGGMTLSIPLSRIYRRIAFTTPEPDAA